MSELFSRLKFDSSTQKMTCEYCGSSYTVEELEELVQTADPLEKEDTKEHWEGFDPGVSGAEENMAVWNCPSCGAQLITEKNSRSGCVSVLFRTYGHAGTV